LIKIFYIYCLRIKLLKKVFVICIDKYLNNDFKNFLYKDSKFSQKVNNFQKELKKIKCLKRYKYLKDFDSRSSDRNLALLENYEVETY
jgi:hypothetical protein